MIRTFGTRGTADIWNGDSTKAARNTCDPNLWGVAQRKLDMVNRATSLNDLRVPPGNRLHPLKGDREGQHAIRINDQYRICFRWKGTDAYEVAITDYH